MFSRRFSLTPHFPRVLGLLLVFGTVGQSIIWAQAVTQKTPAQPNRTQSARPSTSEEGPVAVTPRTNERKVEPEAPKAPKQNQLGNFGFPLLNNSGDLAFTARYASEKSEGGYGSSILIRRADGTWEYVREGDKGKDFPAGLATINHVYLNDKGELTFTGAMNIKTPAFKVSGSEQDASGNTKQGGLFTRTADGLKALYLMGQEIPNNPATYIGFATASMNSKGTLSFIGTYTDPDGRGLFILENGKLSLVARSGQKTPAGDDTQYSEHFYPTTINERGEVAFFCRINAGGAVFLRRPKGIEVIAVQDAPSPIPGGNYIGFGNRTPALSSDGKVAFAGFVDGEKGGRMLFYKGEGPTQVAMRSGDTVPGMTATFTDFMMPSINSKGEIVFVANYAGRARGIFVKTAEGVEAIALNDRPVPGLDPKDERNTFNNFVNPVINDNGDIAFMAQLRNASVGIFYKKKGEPLQMVAKTGDMAPFK